MKTSAAIAQHFYEVNYGNNWTDVAVKDVLKNIDFRMATHSIANANTIAVLLHHMHHYNKVVYNRCFQEAQEQFDHEDSLHVSINNEADWQDLQQRYFKLADALHTAILTLDDAVLFSKRSGNQNTYYKNLHGVVEHIHYHLGQISLLKKIIASS